MLSPRERGISGTGQDLRQEVLLQSRQRPGHTTGNDSVVGARAEEAAQDQGKTSQGRGRWGRALQTSAWPCAQQ